MQSIVNHQSGGIHSDMDKRSEVLLVCIEQMR
jgi:hypothetical protein